MRHFSSSSTFNTLTFLSLVASMDKPSSSLTATTTTMPPKKEEQPEEQDIDPDLQQALAMSLGEEKTTEKTTATTSSDGFAIERSQSVLKKLCVSYTQQNQKLWSAAHVQTVLENSMTSANEMYVNKERMSHAMLQRRWALLEHGALLQYEGIDMNDESSNVHLPGEEPNGGGGGVGGGGGGSGGGPGQEELDVNDPALVLMFQSLMPWNTLTEGGVAVQQRQERAEERNDLNE